MSKHNEDCLMTKKLSRKLIFPNAQEDSKTLWEPHKTLLTFQTALIQIIPSSHAMQKHLTLVSSVTTFSSIFLAMKMIFELLT